MAACVEGTTGRGSTSRLIYGGGVAVCELLAVAWERPEPFSRILPWARGLERVGIAGYGWGVAWLDDRMGAAPVVRGYRHPVSLDEDPGGVAALAGVRSTRFLVHLRRPT